MRQTIIITAIAAIAATFAIWGAMAVGNPQKQKPATHTSGTVDVMQMMRNAKDLPEQHYDAH